MMKRMALISIAFILFFGQIIVFAQEDTDEFAQSYDQLMEDSKANELFDELSPQTEDIMEDMGIEEIDAQTLMNLDIGTICSSVYDSAKENILAPIKLFIGVLAIILISSVLTSLQVNTNLNSTTQAFSIVSVLCVSGVIIPSVISLITATKDIIEQISKFMLGFVPIYTAIISVSGKPVSAFTYSGLLLGVVEIASFFISYAIFPMVGIYFAFNMVGAATGIGNLIGISKTIKSIVLWSLGLFLTIFVGMLTIKSFVASSADTVTMRAGKYVVGSFVPIVGSVISETLGVLQSSLSLIKSSVGVFGIIAVVITVLPTVLSILAFMLALKLSKAVSEIFSNQKIASFLESAGFVLNLLLSVMICYSVMLIVSTSLMLVLGFDK